MVYNVTADSGECWFAALVREECSWSLTSMCRVWIAVMWKRL